MAGRASVGTVFDTIYDRSRRRITEIAGAWSPAQHGTLVPATPRWSARQLVAHLTGVASDAVNGNTEGMPGETWTAAQVAAREGRGMDELLAEWAQVSVGVCAALGARRMPTKIVHDVLTHEADLREAFGLDPLPADDLDVALNHLARGVCKGVRAPGTLVLRAGDREWRGGDGEPVTEVETTPYELYRGLISRRSRRQMRAWRWTGDTERYVDTLPALGPRDDDQPVT